LQRPNTSLRANFSCSVFLQSHLVISKKRQVEREWAFLQRGATWSSKALHRPGSQVHVVEIMPVSCQQPLQAALHRPGLQLSACLEHEIQSCNFTFPARCNTFFPSAGFSAHKIYSHKSLVGSLSVMEEYVSLIPPYKICLSLDFIHAPNTLYRMAHECQ